MLNDEVIRFARTVLLNRARAIRQAVFSDVVECQFTADQIRDGTAGENVGERLKEALGDQITHPALYSLSVEKVETAEAIIASFDGLPDEETRGYRIPKRNPERDGATTLYVGGSKNIRRRLKEHLGSASAKTYALNLRQWCPQFDDVVSVRVQAFSPAVTRECRQDLEDALWETLQPIFGKKGPQ